MDSPQFLFDALEAGDNAFCLPQRRSPLVVATAAFAWHRRSTVIDAWRAVAASMVPLAGPLAVDYAITALKEGTSLRILSGENIWSGPVKRAPAGIRILALTRLARAGALRLFPPWVEEEQALLMWIERSE
jgi:hypothetical protein